MFTRIASSLARSSRRAGQAAVVSARRFSASRAIPRLALLSGVTGVVYYGSSFAQLAQATSVDYNEVRKAIADILDKEGFDDGSVGPILVRLAWHASGSYDAKSKTGGSNGAYMRFAPEKNYGGNAGLQIARDLLEPIKQRFPGISYADLWTLAGVVAIEQSGGPKIDWKAGRTDAPDNKGTAPDGRLPDGAQGAAHVKDVFHRMGFTDRETVALLGAHALGRCHTDRSGFEGPWTHSPTTFSNQFFINLLEVKWTPRKWSGPAQYQDPTGTLMMLPADVSLAEDPAFRPHVEAFAKDEKLFFQEFSSAFAKLLELGVPRH